MLLSISGSPASSPGSPTVTMPEHCVAVPDWPFDGMAKAYSRQELSRPQQLSGSINVSRGGLADRLRDSMGGWSGLHTLGAVIAVLCYAMLIEHNRSNAMEGLS